MSTIVGYATLYYDFRDSMNILADADCDRCGKHVQSAYPYKLSASITFRGKVIEFPWLCPRCAMVEKRKWWAKKGNER